MNNGTSDFQFVNDVEIPLTRGYSTIVDCIDADLAKRKWWAIPRGKFAYAIREEANKTVYLHRVILSRVIGRSLDAREMVDHIDGNKLNNHRSNLRIATFTNNMRNRGKSSSNASGYKGVSWNTRSQKWRASITVHNKHIALGYFDDPRIAHSVYCEAARKYHGEFANFGDNNEH